jgi:8-oxo-dGTP diphosphatase
MNSAMCTDGGHEQLVGAVLVNARAHAYIQRRSSSRPVFPDAWDIVGGRVEPGENAREALVREIHEETGVTAGLDIHWFACRWIRLQADTAHECLAWVRLDRGDEPLRLEEGKFTEGAWVDNTDARLADNLRLGYNDHIPSAVLMALYLSAKNGDAQTCRSGR